MHVPLHSLRVGCCFKITRTTVAIALACPYFVSIRFPGCSKVADAASLSAGALLRSISCIDLSSCILITDAGRVIVTRMLPIERHQSLTLQAFDGWLFDRCRMRTSWTSIIVLTSCKQISDVVIAALAQGCCQLRKVVKTDCERVSHSTIARLGEGCASLTSLAITRTQMPP